MGVIALVISFILGGTQGLAGMLIGLASALFGVAVLWQLVQLLGRSVSAGRNAGCGTFLTIGGFFAKLPLYIACGMVAARLGHAAFSCFLAGVVLVYFCLVARAVARP